MVPFFRVAFATAAIGLVGCGPSPGVDAATDVPRDASLIDAIDAVPDEVSDVQEADVGCEEFAGTYSLSSICIPLSASMFGAMCVEQNGCDLSLHADGISFHGTARGSTAALTSAQRPSESCTLAHTTSGLAVRCTNSAENSACSGTAYDLTVRSASRFCCDAVHQDCGSAQRCTLVLAGDSGSLITACLPVSGTLGDGASCTRQMGMVGFDPCAPGLFCANTGQPSRDTRVCHPFCATSADCAAGSVCYNLSGVAVIGVCTPACTIGGTDCGTGTTCRYAPVLDGSGNRTFAGICDPIGTVAHGDTCWDSAQCMPGDTCGYSHTGPVCQTICDNEHPCPTGQTCVSNLPSGTPNPPGQGSCQ